MGFQLLLRICALLFLGGYAFAEEPGTEFAFVFMQNLLPNVSDLHLEVLLTAFFPDTQATIQLPNKNYSKVVPLMPRSPLTVELPEETEILYSSRSNNAVRISSNKPISVIAINSKPYKTSVTAISPVASWGIEYYIVMPDIEPEESFRQVAIVNGPELNFVSILLRGMVEFEHTVYLAGEHLDVTLNPWEVIQLKANESLSGSHVVSQEPVALFSGRTCAEICGKCQICLQLPPVSAWGSKFVAPPLPYPKVSSKVYIFAAADTDVKLALGTNVIPVMVTSGVVKELNFDPTMTLLISSPGNILVLLYFGEGLLEPSEGFLFHLAPRESTCSSYAVVSVPRFMTMLLVVTHEDGREELQLNFKPLPQTIWKELLGTDFVYTLLPLHGKSEYYTIDNPKHIFLVATIGMEQMNTYGMLGICLDKVYQCPSNAYYSTCATACQAICGFNFQLACPPSCQEGCVCNPGYILNGDHCITTQECGCYTDGGHFIKEGDIIYEDGCQVACSCLGGEVVCANHTCSANERCQTIEGVTACYPEPITCWMYRQKYHTFDGITFRAHEGCLYMMVTTKCAANETDDLTIEFQMSGNNSQSTIESIRLTIYGHTIIIQEYNDGVEIDGITYPLPFDMEKVIRVSRKYSGNDSCIQIEAALGLMLTASPSVAWINLTSHYAGNICGLCGNANGNASDDFGGLSPEDFLSSWNSPYDNSSCRPSSESISDKQFPYNLVESCDVIVMAEGAFSSCHALIDPSWFLNTCLDYASGDLAESVCRTIMDYASECRALGATVHQWENRTVCGYYGISVQQEKQQTVRPTHPTTQKSTLIFNKLHVVGDRNDSNHMGCMYQSSVQHVLPESSSPDLVYCIVPLAFVHNTSEMEHFSIQVDYLTGSSSVFHLIMKVHGTNILVPSEMGEIIVNGIPKSLPVSLASDKVHMWFNYPNLIMTTDFGLQVILSVNGDVFILAPAKYKDHLYGYCSNQRSTILTEEQYLCVTITRVRLSCKNMTISYDGCSLLLDREGPFQACQKIFEPMIYYEECQRLFL